VLVVGAGVAGGVAALSALKNGIDDVLIIEKSDKIGGSASQKIDFVEHMRLDHIIDELDLSVNYSSNKSRWYSPKNRCFTYESKIADLWIKRGPTKDSFENRTIAAAIKGGADLRLNTKVIDFREDIIVKKDEKRNKIKAKAVIDASGANSKVRNLLVENYYNETIDKIIGYGVVGTDFNMEEGVPEIFFDSKLAPRSYVLACKDPNDGMGYIIQGIGKNGNVNPKKYFQRLTEKNGKLKDILDGAIIKETIQGLLYIKKTVPEKYGFNNVMFVGDSAHIMDPFLHYGVGPAIISGYLSGKTAADYLVTGDKDSLKNYENEMIETISSEFKKRLRYRKIFDKLNNNDMEKIFGLIIDMKEKKVDFDSFFENPYRYSSEMLRVIFNNLTVMPLLLKTAITRYI
jgi:flavin-dependent dehydrogenase